MAHHHEHDGAEGQPVLGGAPGGRRSAIAAFLESNEKVILWLTDRASWQGTLADEDKDNAGAEWQVWSKPMPQDSVAVLLINAADGVADLSLILSNHVGGQVAVRSIWDGKDLGVHSGVMYFPSMAAHDSVFLLLTPT